MSQPSASQAESRGIWPRIKEHKLIQATLAYLAGALAVAHGEELVANAFHWSERVGQVVIAVLAVGLPLTLLVVWLATRRRSSASATASGQTLNRIFVVVLVLVFAGPIFERLLTGSGGAQMKFGGLLYLALGLLAVGLLTDRLWLGRRAAEGRSLAANPSSPATSAQLAASANTAVTEVQKATPSIAVLPFANLSSDREQEYFSDGLSEELINHLAHVKGLRVLARTSSFAFKGRNEDLRVIGEKLSVGCVLEGSVRKAGNRLRITAQLVDCANGYHLWSETFDRELDDVFAIQNDISRQVAVALGVALGFGERTTSGGTSNLEAYDLYLRAQALQRQLEPEALRRSVELYRQALALDSGFALAWSGLVHTLLFVGIWIPESAAQFEAEASQALQRARAIAPDSGASRAAGALWHVLRHDWLAAEQMLGKIRESGASSAYSAGQPHFELLAGCGRASEAAAFARELLAADPLNPLTSACLQEALTTIGRYEEADVEYRRSLDLAGKPESIEHVAICRAWARGVSSSEIRVYLRRFLDADRVPMPVQHEMTELIDRPEAARARLRQAFDDPAYQDGTRQFRLALWAGQFGDVELALAAARRAYIDMRAYGVYLLWLPNYREVRKDARFKELLRDLKIVDYWRASGKWGDFARPVGANDFEVW